MISEVKPCLCDTCVFSPPSSTDGKPCCVCDTGNPVLNCYQRRVEKLFTKEELFAAVRVLIAHCESHDVYYCGCKCPLRNLCVEYFEYAPKNWPDPEEVGETKC